MKKYLCTLFFLAFVASVFAQAPSSFKYQTVVRDATGSLLANKPVTFRISILRDDKTDILVYQETHVATTNDFGLANLSIGAGTSKSGTISSIDWATGPYLMKVEMQQSGSKVFNEMGTTELLSVPYSLYAQTADGLNTETPVNGDILVYSGTKWNQLHAGTNGQILTITNNVPKWKDSHFIGEEYGGGIIFWLDENKEHGLISARDDLDDARWIKGSNKICIAFRNGIYAGEINTNNIISSLGDSNPVDAYAALRCTYYSTNFKEIAYGDWYLPSAVELEILCTQKTLVGGFSAVEYWSSTEHGIDVDGAYTVNFISGASGKAGWEWKENIHKVRCIRRF